MTQTKDHKETEEIQNIKALIQSFFDRINASDPKGLQQLFAEKADLTIIKQDPPLPPPESFSSSSASHNGEEKLTVLLRTTIEGFVKMIEDGEKRRHGKPGPKVHEVPDLDATDVKIDGLFGSAWCPFRVTFDGVLHHYGTFVFTFGKGDGGGEWRFEGLTQNYRRTPGWEGDSEFV